MVLTALNEYDDDVTQDDGTKAHCAGADGVGDGDSYFVYLLSYG